MKESLRDATMELPISTANLDVSPVSPVSPESRTTQSRATEIWSTSTFFTMICFFNFFASFISTCQKGGWGHAPCCAFQDTSNHASNDTGARDGVAQFCCRLSSSDNHFLVYTDFFMICEGVSHTLVDSYIRHVHFHRQVFKSLVLHRKVPNN